MLAAVAGDRPGGDNELFIGAWAGRVDAGGEAGEQGRLASVWQRPVARAIKRGVDEFTAHKSLFVSEIEAGRPSTGDHVAPFDASGEEIEPVAQGPACAANEACRVAVIVEAGVALCGG